MRQEGKVSAQGIRVLGVCGRVALVTSFVMATSSASQWSVTERKAGASDASPGDLFGLSVDICGDTAIVGAPRNYLDPSTPGGANAEGSAYVLERDATGAWVEVASLTASDAAIGAEFGYAVAISGDTAVVGAWLEDQAASVNSQFGAAYVFERNHGGLGAWGEVTKLTSSDSAPGDLFGFSVGIDGDTLVIGAWSDDHAAGVDAGSVYVFDRDQGGEEAWGEVAKLVASDGAAGDWFGTSCDIKGNRVVIGASGADDPNELDVGAAYVFERGAGSPSVWQEAAKLTASDKAAGDWFGVSIALSNDTIVVGAFLDDLGDLGDPEGLADAGSAYVYERIQGGASWTESAKLTAGDGAGDSDQFGISVSLDGDTILVGAFRDNNSGGPDAGAAHFFERNQGGPNAWREVAKLTAKDAGIGDEFGAAVAVDGRNLIVGAKAASGHSVDGVRGLAVDPVTNTVYGSDVVNDNLVTLDPLTGQASVIGPLGFGDVQGLAFDPSTGKLYGVDDATDNLIQIDTTTGAGTAIGPHGFPHVWGLAFDPVTNTLYGSKEGSSGVVKLITIDTATGMGTNVGSIGFPEVWGLAFDPATNALYGSKEGALGASGLITIDATTGIGQEVGPTGFGDVQGLGFSSSANQLMGTNPETGEVISIDPLSGAGAAIGLYVVEADDSRAIYTYEASFEAVSFCTAGTSASGCQATLSAMGSASSSEATGFHLTATGVEGAKDGQFYYGTNGAQANPWGGSTSFQCIVPPVTRAGLLAGTGSAGLCDGFFSQDLNALWSSKPEKSPGFGYAYAQLWYRDPLGTSDQTTGLSDAIEFYVFP